MITNDELYAAAKNRFSSRRYSGGVSDKELSTLSEIADELSCNGFRICVLRGSEALASAAGGVKGTDAFAAFVAEKDFSPIKSGYLGEKFVLSCVAIGLGTCWMSGTYNRKKTAELCLRKSGERIVSVAAIGKSDDAPAHYRRKSIESLCGLTPERFGRLPLWQQSAVECARIAPSALNLQPWQFVVDTYSITVSAGMIGYTGFGLLDCGITALHIELGALSLGMNGTWEYSRRLARFVQVN